MFYFDTSRYQCYKSGILSWIRSFPHPRSATLNSCTILEKFIKLKIPIHLCLHINQNWPHFFTFSSLYHNLIFNTLKNCRKALRNNGRIRDPNKVYSGYRIKGSKRHRSPDPGSATLADTVPYLMQFGGFSQIPKICAWSVSIFNFV
jgi:hypothetical protein